MNDYKTYAKLLLGEFRNKSSQDFDEFFRKFIALLKSKKQLSLLPKIYKEIKQLSKTNKNRDKTILIVKNKQILDNLEKEISKYSDVFDLENLEIQEEKNIVGGFILKNNKNILNNSYKQKLLALYKKLIN